MRVSPKHRHWHVKYCYGRQNNKPVVVAVVFVMLKATSVYKSMFKAANTV